MVTRIHNMDKKKNLMSTGKIQRDKSKATWSEQICKNQQGTQQALMAWTVAEAFSYYIIFGTTHFFLNIWFKNNIY